MSKSIIIKTKSLLAGVRTVSGIGIFAILAMLFVFTVGNTQAAGDEHSQTVQTSKDAPAGHAAVQKAAKDAPAATAKSEPAKEAKKSYGPIGTMFAY
ncbi:MAG: hypothetical protein JRJ37_07490, partial [Deltaproteobacteria bacterium]|nr:hypothetical protein [Deltaproteobacteria bacterium]